MITKSELIDGLRAVFQSWEKALEEASEKEITAQLRPGGWSIREIITHLCAWQQISVAYLEAALADTEPHFPEWLGGADPAYAEGHVDEFNARIQETCRSQSWSERHGSWREGFLKLLESADRIPDSILFDPERYPWLGGDALSAVLEGSRDHHLHHLNRLQALLGR